MKKYEQFLDLKQNIHELKNEIIIEIENYLNDKKLYNNIIEIILNEKNNIDQLILILDCELSHKDINDFIEYFQLKYNGYSKNIIHMSDYNNEKYSYSFKNKYV